MLSARDKVLAELIRKHRLVDERTLQTCIERVSGIEGALLGKELVNLGILRKSQLATLADELDGIFKGRGQDNTIKIKGSLFGALFVSKGYCSEEDVQVALEAQRADRESNRGKHLGYYLLTHGSVTEEQINAILDLQNKCVIVCSYCESAYNVEGLTPGKKIVCKKCLNLISIADPKAVRSDATRNIQKEEIVFSGEGDNVKVEVREADKEGSTVMTMGSGVIGKEDGGVQTPQLPKNIAKRQTSEIDSLEAEYADLFEDDGNVNKTQMIDGKALAEEMQKSVAGPAPGKSDKPEFVESTAQTKTKPPKEPEPMTEEDQELIGKTIGGCNLVRKLGQGAMGAVWLGKHSLLDKDVAIKLLPKGMLGDQSAIQRFYKEARLAARLEHENIVSVHNVGWEEGYHFFVMQFVDGEDLASLIEREGALEYSKALSILTKILKALAYAHDLGLVHRDIKPENILVSGDVVKVADFGLVKDVTEKDADLSLSGEGRIVGSPHYMPPEIVNEEEADNRSDIYSLGCTTYYLLSGRRPFDGAGSLINLLMKHLNEKPKPISALAPNTPPQIVTLVEGMMEKDREKRFQTADAVLEAVGRVVSDAGVRKNVSDGTIKRAADAQVQTAEAYVCPQCAAEIPEGASVCPACDTPIGIASEIADDITEARELAEGGLFGDALRKALDIFGRVPRNQAVQNLVFDIEQQMRRAQQIHELKQMLKVFADSKNFDKAIQVCEEAIQVAPEEIELSHTLEDLKVLVNIARKKELTDAVMSALKEKDAESVVQFADELLKIDPTMDQIRKFRDKCREIVQRVEKMVDDARNLDAKGDRLEAAKQLKNALALNPKHVLARTMFESIMHTLK
ncbi:MAG: serine/threonine-protein kinase [Planctomycetes bacterium]|nr:serine/threonine-protein kinase [Planctomycetota bacterium]